MKSETHYIKAGWMIDGSGAPVESKILLTVENGIITDVDRFKESDSLNAALVTDLSCCTIMPPLIDCHVHLAMSASTDPQIRKQQLRATRYDDCKNRIADHLHSLFSYGVLGVRDGGDHYGHVLRFKNETETEGNGKEPVSIKTAGRAWHQKGRYGAFIGSHLAEGKTLETAVAQESELVDHVKLINSGLNSFTEFAKETAAQFSCEEIKSVVKLMEQKGKKVMVHANGRIPVRLALEAGCHSIEHGFFMGEENLKRMADKQITWVPTAFTMKAALDNWDSDTNGRSKKAVIVKNMDNQMEQIAMARQYGVRVVLGTDAGCSGIIHGESVVEELKLLMKAGYSLVEAIRCASHNGAKLLAMKGFGSIAKGRPAHFIVVRATPAMLPGKLSSLEAIYLNGMPCKKDFFNEF